MALTQIRGGLFLPWLYLYPNFATHVSLTASGHKWAWIFRCPKTGLLRGFGHWVGSITSLNAASKMRYSFQNVNGANGFPDGVQDQWQDVLGASISASTWLDISPLTDTGDSGGNRREVTKGDLLAAVVEYETFNTSDIYDFLKADLATSSLALAFPYHVEDTGSGYAKQARASFFALKYTDGSYEPVSPDLFPVTSLNQDSFNSGSTPDEIGIKIVPPFPAKASGFWSRISASSGRAWDVILYDEDDVELDSLSLNYDILSSGSMQFHYFSAEIALEINKTYRLAVKPTTTNSIQLFRLDLPGAAHMDGLSGGSAVVKTYRTNGGAWSQNTAQRPFLALALSHFESDIPYVSSGRGFTRGMVR